jgi:hypothetical protein
VQIYVTDWGHIPITADELAEAGARYSRRGHPINGEARMLHVLLSRYVMDGGE